MVRPEDPVLQRQLPFLAQALWSHSRGVEQIRPDHPAIDPDPLGRAVPR